MCKISIKSTIEAAEYNFRVTNPSASEKSIKQLVNDSMDEYYTENPDILESAQIDFTGLDESELTIIQNLFINTENYEKAAELKQLINQL